jgi:hypothetical protein
LVTLAGGLVWHFVSNSTPERDTSPTASQSLRVGSSLSADHLGLSLSADF